MGSMESRLLYILMHGNIFFFESVYDYLAKNISCQSFRDLNLVCIVCIFILFDVRFSSGKNTSWFDLCQAGRKNNCLTKNLCARFSLSSHELTMATKFFNWPSHISKLRQIYIPLHTREILKWGMLWNYVLV